jgi:hypothetical protein
MEYFLLSFNARNKLWYGKKVLTVLVCFCIKYFKLLSILQRLCILLIKCNACRQQARQHVEPVRCAGCIPSLNKFCSLTLVRVPNRGFFFISHIKFFRQHGSRQ